MSCVHDGDHTSMCHINACQVFLKHGEQTHVTAQVGRFISLSWTRRYSNMWSASFVFFPSDNYIDNLPIDIQMYSFNSLAFIFQLLILFLFILVCFTGMFEDDIKCILKLAFMGNGQQGGIVWIVATLCWKHCICYIWVFILLAYLLFSIWIF